MLVEAKVEIVVPGLCDRCGSRAKAVASKIASKDTLTLLFCGHHERIYAPALKKEGFELTTTE